MRTEIMSQQGFTVSLERKALINSVSRSVSPDRKAMQFKVGSSHKKRERQRILLHNIGYCRKSIGTLRQNKKQIR